MADQENEQQQSGNPQTITQFGKGLNKDLQDSNYSPGFYVHARNATIVLPDGQTGNALHTECGFSLETTIPYTLIGRILLTEDQWVVFSTDNTTSEIGLYIEGTGVYTTMLNDAATIAAGLPGLNLKTTNLITGAARRNFDCGFDVYWSDALNPDRMLDTAYLYPNPWIQNCVTTSSCITCTNTNRIDVEQLRLAPQFSIPCLTLVKNPGSGTLPNGSYQVTMRYAINGIPCTDFLALSNIQPVFSHNNDAGSISVNISGISSETTVIFPEIEVVVISMTNFNVQAKKLGIYSSSQQVISIDDLNPELINVPLNLLPVSTPIIDKSDAIYSISNYLVRVGTYEKPEFNYQPLANQIIAKWVAVQYSDDYYYKGGLSGQPLNVSNLREEVYAYYIRWGYTTGDKSAAYPIPGLPAGTAPTISIGGPSVGDGGVTIASGRFEGYSSTEIYPNDEPSIWGSLCGQPIRHHKFPSQDSFPGTILSHYNPVVPFTISVLGVYFENIQPPVDINGVIIPNIQGYEILRATRDGNKHVIACGMVNHMRGYINPDGSQGLYQNYPYDDLNPDVYLTSSQTIGTVGGTVDDWSGNTLDIVHSDFVSFHSPDTVFRHPELGSGSLGLKMAMSGSSIGNFHQSYKHPKFRVLTDRSSQIGTIIGTMITVADIMSTLSGAGTNLQLSSTNAIPMVTPFGISAVAEGTLGATGDIIYAAGVIQAGILATVLGPLQERVIQNQIMTVIQGLVPEIEYAWQYDSHGFYDNPIPTPSFETQIRDYAYVKGHLQSFDNFDVNNLFRNNYVLMNLANGIPSFPVPYNTSPLADTSRFTLKQSTMLPNVVFSGNAPKNVHLTTIGPFTAPIVSWYAHYTVPQPSQYGQVDSPKLIPIGCMQSYSRTTMTSGVLFGGDTYINRYTEENPMMFFNDWLVDTTPDFPYDYTTVENVPYPRYWINNTKVYYDFWQQASKNWHVDEPDLGTVIFGVGLALYLKNGYFYLFNNGVRDFYVESEVNVGFRDWEDVPGKRFYDPYRYTSLDYLFRSDTIKSDTLYKYDYSLSAGKFWNNYLSWGQCLDRDYNPILAYTCYNYYPRRIMYSLPQEEELRKDNWKVFLPNNYVDMPTKVTAIKDVHKTGALILLYDQAPQAYAGTESIPSRSGTDYIVGNGKLFDQSLQSVTNVDDGYQYGSCQSRQSVVSLTHGVFWVSQNTGKIFQYAPGKAYYNKGETLIDITEMGLKYWMSQYLPSQLLLQFPSYPLYDNPVSGVGVQLYYDNTNEILYISKKDFRVNNTYLGSVTLSGSTFRIFNVHADRFINITLGDPMYFDDCSWTVSYSPEGKKFISYHDYVPAFNIPAKTHPLLTSTSLGDIGNEFWRMNNRVDLFCNYFGRQFPFEIQYPIVTGATVTTLQSVAVVIESYLYQINKTDKFLVFDGFMDQAIISNREQCSGLLELNLRNVNDPYGNLNYPIQDAMGTQVLYSRVENSWRIDQFIDITRNRFEFGLGNQNMFTTAHNGYTFSINPLYLDYNKPFNQRKRIRGRNTFIFLRKIKPGQNGLSIIFAKTTNQISLR